MSPTELFLLAMLVIFAIPYLAWRLSGRADLLPLVVVQILTGIALGPGALGSLLPNAYAVVFAAPVIQALNGVAWWAVMLFVWIAGLELDLPGVRSRLAETSLTAALALGVPMLFGGAVAMLLLAGDGWVGSAARPWQFVTGIGMACAVTALPILVLLMEQLAILREPIGQRILRYASLDDVAIWGVLAVILMDWQRVGRQLAFLLVFALAAAGWRWLVPRLAMRDRWYASLVWLLGVAFGADWSGLHFMVGAFLAGAVSDGTWYDQAETDRMRHLMLLSLMPVFFLSTGLRTSWSMGGWMVVAVAAALLLAAVAGKLLGVRLAGSLLGWSAAESRLVGWLLQTKALIMIIFVNVLLDRQLITSGSFTALLLMAVASTVLTVPMARPLWRGLQEKTVRVP